MKYKIKLKKVNSLLALLIYRPRSLSSIFNFFSILFSHTDFTFTHNMRHITIIIMCSVSVVLTQYLAVAFITMLCIIIVCCCCFTAWKTVKGAIDILQHVIFFSCPLLRIRNDYVCNVCMYTYTEGNERVENM